MIDIKEEKNEIVKLILVGNTSVGKTTIINRYDRDYFSDKVISTYSYNNIRKNIKLENQSIILDIWDTAGQEQFRAVGKLYLKKARIAVLVYDITSKDSFEGINFWYNFIKEELGDKIILGIAGNKADLFEQGDKTLIDLGEEYAKKWGAVFALLSAKDDREGIVRFFEDLTRKYIEKKSLFIDEITTSGTIIITKHPKGQNEITKGCCGGGKNKKEKEINIPFFGGKGVGKTSIIRILRGKKKKAYKHTEKVNRKKATYIIDKKKIKINFIDTIGDDFSDEQMEKILDNCKMVFLVFDLSHKSSFNKLDDLRQKITKKRKEIECINILGNKSDLTKGDICCVTDTEAQKFAKENGGHYEEFSYNNIEQIDNIKDLIKDNISSYFYSEIQ